MVKVHITQQRHKTPKKKHCPARFFFLKQSCPARIRPYLDYILIVILDSEIESGFKIKKERCLDLILVVIISFA